MTMSSTVIKVMQDCSSGYASANGLKMYYEIHGTGLPLVLIHGGGLQSKPHLDESFIPLQEKKHPLVRLNLMSSQLQTSKS